MDIVQKVEEIAGLDDQVHWFCPRYGNEDAALFFDEDLTINDAEYLRSEGQEARTAREKTLQEAEERTGQVLDACTILAFDGEDARPFQDKLKSALQHQLTRCDVCIRQYHRARSKLKSNLEGQYGTDEVQSFMETFDAMNKERITAGLDKAKQTLQALPPDARNISSCGDVGMYAMFEALSCIPFLEDEEALQQYFDQPFELVQTRKKIKLPSYAPGMVAFLYSHKDLRASWARRNYAAVKHNVLPSQFEHAVQPFLEKALSRVGISWLDEKFLPLFWSGTHTLLAKLPGDVISQQLRALELNLWTTSLEHFQLNMSHFDSLVGSYQILLERAPRDFWDALGIITPQAVLDTIFQAPRLKAAMLTDGTDLEQKFIWLEPFIASIKASNLVSPVRAIADQMLNRYQQDSYAEPCRKTTHELGLRALLGTLRMLRESSPLGPSGLQILELVAKDYTQNILLCLRDVETKDEMRLTKLQETCLKLVEMSLALDCKSMLEARAIIVQASKNSIPSMPEFQIWIRVCRSVKPGHPTLAAAILVGSRDLLGLEELAPRQVEAAPKYGKEWNGKLLRIYNSICDMLERLQASSSEQLTEIVQDQHAAPGLFAMLFSGEQQIHTASLDLLKALSGEVGRKDAMKYLVKHHFSSTAHGVATALRVIARGKCYTPCPNMIKIVTDVYSCLSDDTDGLLRSAVKLSKHDIGLLENLWQCSWISLNLIFDMTEAWSNLGYKKDVLQNFCRDTMDFAETVFDDFSLFAGAISDATSSSIEGVRMRLLERPKAIFINVAKWLRLRDDYLITKAVKLTCKMLSRLEEADIEVSQDAATLIDNVVSNKIKTKLTINQKAEIQRALENHLGQLLKQPTSLDTTAAPLKQSSLQGWTSNQTSGRSTPTQPKKPTSGVIDVDAWDAAAKKKRAESDALGSLLDKATTTSAQYKQQQAVKKPTSSITSRKALEDERKRAEFKLKRQHDKEAAEKAKAAALAKANGIGAGSGVLGLGNIGKDHSMKGQNVMISSDEESDSEEDFDDELFGPKEKRERKVRGTDVDTMGAIGLKPEQKRGPTRIQRTQRSQKDMRARLAPNLQALHRTILQWSFFHDGDYPPGSNEHQFREVVNVFHDPSSYQDTFKPLLTLEAWQGMVKAREENQNKPYEFKVQSRTNVDALLEISSFVSHKDNRDHQLQEGDIVLLAKASKPTESKDEPHCLARISRTKRQKAGLEIVYQLMPGGQLDRHLVTQATIYGVKIQSIVPLEREYGALQGLQYYDLCNQIVRAQPSNRVSFSQKQIAAFQDNWNVNPAQSEAINAALVNEGFSLIQGPPGSGKTKTIVAIVGGLLSDTLGAANNKATKLTVPGQQAGQNDAAPRKLLVCAPSNAAVDELVMRLKGGVKTKNGRQHALNVVRIGRSDAINTQVLDVTMDELVSKKLGTSGTDQDARNNQAEVFKQHQKVTQELSALFDKRDSEQVKGQDAIDLQEQIVALRKRKNELGSKIDVIKDNEKTAGREAELSRKRAQQAVLDQAHVICATLSGSGHDMFQNLNIEFETVIIDEAAQCVEMSSLIPLKYGCVKCIMVGDPKQLPPTVFSKEAARFQYEQSLFVRMQNNAAAEVHLLDTQYRMHPQISLFPSRTFYDGLLKDGSGMAGLRKQPWHASELLGPYRFFDVQGQHQAAPKGHSLVNLAEIKVALALYNRVRTDFASYDLRGKIGIITPYKSQLTALKGQFSVLYGNDIFETIEFNTTDAFQGRESEIIIFSCVRASPAGGIGFLQDIRRMNVGLTRAKSSLWVLGNSESLVRGRYWKMLVEDAQSRDSYSSGDVLGMLQKASSHFKAKQGKDTSMFDVSAHQQQMVSSKAVEAPKQKAENSSSHAKQGNTASNSKGHNEGRSEQESRMEGVTYRFEDRIKKRAAPGGEDDRKGRQRIDEDVEMADASDTGRSTTATSTGGPSRNGTPVPLTTGNASSACVNGQAARLNGAPQKTVRKGGTDPFIRPRKR